MEEKKKSAWRAVVFTALTAIASIAGTTMFHQMIEYDAMENQQSSNTDDINDMQVRVRKNETLVSRNNDKIQTIINILEENNDHIRWLHINMGTLIGPMCANPDLGKRPRIPYKSNGDVK